jgi:cobalt/nickel transport system ATP-binding protein
MAAPLISVRDLHYRYPDGTHALRGVDFTLEAGETVVLLGANGSGKTTFALHLNGLLPGGDKVRVCGLPVVPANLPEIRRKVGVVFQNSDEQLFMASVLDDVAFGPLNRGLPPEEAYALARSALAEVGLEEAGERVPHHLSAGQKKRAAIAGVLAMDPSVLILDEPTVFLDPPGQRNLFDLLDRLPQAKIVVTHDLHLARRLGTRALFFREGRIAGEGPVDAVIRQFEWEVETPAGIGD